MLLQKLCFWKEDWAFFPSKILSLKSFGKSWCNSYKMFFIVDINYRFTSGEFKLFENSTKFQNIMTMIVVLPKAVVFTDENSGMKKNMVHSVTQFYIL